MASYLGAINPYTKQDSVIYERCISELKKSADLPINELLVKAALYFQDKPYVASTLDQNPEEQLVVNLREFDCTTLVESCIALVGVAKSGDYSFEHYSYLLSLLRYRHGRIDGYASRLHYMTDWVYDNSQKGVLSDITLDLGGGIYDKSISFMSKHTDSYSPLKNNPLLQQKIEVMENEINDRKSYSFIAKADIKRVENKIENGDIIIFATTLEGLDYSHIGIAYRDGDRLSFIHASTRTKKVIIEPRSLYDYCSTSSRCSGISIVRLNN